MTTTIFHTSPVEIANIQLPWLSDSPFGDVFFFSQSVYSIGDGARITYKMEIEDEEIVNVSQLTDERGKADILDLFDDAFGCQLKDEEVDEFFNADQSVYDFVDAVVDYSDDVFFGVGEVDWEIQKIQGEAARRQGFLAAKGRDEQGEVYIVRLTEEIFQERMVIVEDE